MSKKVLGTEVGQICHQGDIFLRVKAINVTKAPKLNGKKVALTQGKLSVHHGEAIGHHHMIENPDAVELHFVGVEEATKKMELYVKEKTALVHGDLSRKAGELDDPKTTDHTKIELLPGTVIDISTQQEFRDGLMRGIAD